MGIAKDKLTDGQKKEVERLRQFVSRNRFNVLMNSTKWRAAIDAIAGIEGYPAPYRVRCVTDTQDPPVQWVPGFPGGLPLYNAIEWLELNPKISVPGKSKPIDFGEAIKKALETERIPMAVETSGIRILGHTRAGR